jgi:hypothetical protein
MDARRTGLSNRRRAAGGRPALAPEDRRCLGSTIALTLAELTAIRVAAERRGLPVAVWVRETALAAAGAASAVPLSSAPPPVLAALLRELVRVGVNINQLAHAANRAGMVLDNPASSGGDRTKAHAGLRDSISAAAGLAGAGSELAALVSRIEAAFSPGPAIVSGSRKL